MRLSLQHFVRIGLVVAVVFGTGRVARAEPGPSCTTVARTNVAACVLGASANVAAERAGKTAAEGRRTAAEPWFPSNPVLSFSAARRTGMNASATNVYGILSQEIEIAGQRASRRRAADAEIDARGADVVAQTRRVEAAAYTAWFRAVAARDATRIAERLEAQGADVARVTRARADAGVGSELDAEVAAAAALRFARDKVEASRQERVAAAALATLLGRDPGRELALEVDARALEPLAGSDAAVARVSGSTALERPEVRALKLEERAHASRAEAFRRARFPTLTLQIFAQNDGFDEKVLGGGLALPLPLPQPLGRTYAGEAAEADALAQQTSFRASATARELSTELANAITAWQAAKSESALYTDDRVARAEKILADVAKEIEAGRLGVRDAVLAQRELTEVLRARIETRRALALASVDVLYASGAVLEGASR